VTVASGHTVLQVPVPALEPFVRTRAAHYDPAWVSDDAGFVHAHVTALAPFLPAAALDRPAQGRVAEIVAETAAFTFELARVATFPNGIIHLLPEPSEPFRELTARLVEAFPECPPYEGRFPEVIPHLTLDAQAPGVTEQSTIRLLGDLVPVQCRAERLDLAWYEADGCHVIRSWALGATVQETADTASGFGSVGAGGARSIVKRGRKNWTSGPMETA
jgi:hypothetical protein